RPFAADRREPLQEARRNGRCAVELDRMGEKDLAHAEQLRKIMRAKSDTPLWQIEAELLAHRPAQPSIGARIGRPHPFDKSADDDAIDADKPRFERTVYADAAAGRAAPAHDAFLDCEPEQLHIVLGRGVERLG